MACPYDYNDNTLKKYCASDNFICWNVDLNFEKTRCPGPNNLVPGFINGPISGPPNISEGDVCLSLYNGSYTQDTPLNVHYNPNRDGTPTDDQKYGNTPNDFVIFKATPDPRDINKFYYFSSPINPNACEASLPATIPFIPRGPSESGLSNEIDYAFFPTITGNQVCSSYKQTCAVAYDRLFYSTRDLGSLTPAQAFAANTSTSKQLYNQTFLPSIDTDPLRPGVGVRDRIMASYCPQITVDTSQCPIQPLGNTKPTNCTNFSADPTCHQWTDDFMGAYIAGINGKGAPVPSDKVIIYNTAVMSACAGKDPAIFQECSCENMTQTKQWQEIQSAASSIGVPFNPEAPQCWFVPCQGPYVDGFYLNNTSSLIQPGTCPSICEVITNIKDNPNSHIDIGSINAYINCAGSPNPPSPNPIVNLWDKYKWWIIGGIIIFILLIIILIFVIK